MCMTSTSHEKPRAIGNPAELQQGSFGRWALRMLAKSSSDLKLNGGKILIINAVGPSCDQVT